MATMEEAKRRLTYEVQDRGLTETTQKLKQLDSATDGVAEASRRAESATQSMERRLNSIQRQYDSAYRSQQQMEKIERDLNSAQAQGLLTSQRRLELLSLAAERHGLATAAITREAAATDRLASARMVAANQNALSASGLQTSNIAAQFQDIAVTSAMGMSPIQIALQQGTQLQAVLGPMGAGGAVRALGGAFLSLLNPVSLVTLALVGGTAALVQYFMSGEDEAKSFDEVLKRHEDSVRALKESWGDAADGITAYGTRSRAVAEAQNISSGFKIGDELEKFTKDLVGSGLLVRTETEKIKADIDRVSEAMVGKSGPSYAALNAELETLFGRLSNVGSEALVATTQFAPLKAEIDAFGASVRAGTPDYIRLQEAIAEELRADPTNRALADLNAEIGDMVEHGVKLQLSLKTSAGAIDEIGAAAARQADIVRGFASAMETLANIALPQVAASDRAYEAYHRALMGATTPGARASADAQLLAALERIETSNIPIPPERPNREDALTVTRGSSGKSEGEKLSERYARIVRDANQATEAFRVQERALGMTDKAALALRIEAELLNRAQDAGIKLTATQRTELAGLAEVQASASASFERTRAQMELGRDLTKDFLGGMLRDVRNGADAVEALGNAFGRLGDRLLDMALDEGISMLFQNLSGGGKSSDPWAGMREVGGGGGLLGSLFGFLFNANGNAFAGGNVIPFARGGVVDRPTVFPMANGAGLMGEAGPEAIMPLRRGADGKLGVASSGGGSMTVPISISVDASGADPAAVARLEATLAKFKRELPAAIISTVSAAPRRGMLK